MMKRCIIETPFAAPKELRDNLNQLQLALTNSSNLSRLEYAELYKLRDKARKAVSRAQARNKAYLRRVARHLLFQGWTPFASHAVYTQWLDDTIPAERALGMNAGLPWYVGVEDVFFGIDLGMSPGMEWGMERHKEAGRNIHMLELGSNWERKSNDT